MNDLRISAVRMVRAYRSQQGRVCRVRPYVVATHVWGAAVSAPPPDGAAPPRVCVDAEGRHVALLIDGREYVFSAARDVATRVELLEQWAEYCRAAAAALRRCHAQLQVEQRKSAELAAVTGGLRPCTLCQTPNAATRAACHWCGNPLAGADFPPCD